MSAEAAAAALAAAEADRRRRDEEERLTSPDRFGFGPDWEFKIIRSATPRFRRTAYLEKVLAAESRWGWELFEKLDDYRVRLRRHTRHRQRDASLGGDAYRIWYGLTEGAFVALLVAGTSLVLVAVGVFLLGR